jgi:phosphoglycerate kinase
MHNKGTNQMLCQSKIPEWNLYLKKIFLRADLNIPLLNGTILDDHRLLAILPTIHLILAKKGKILLASHIGRPKQPEQKLSTKVLLPWFQKEGFSIDFAATPKEADQKLTNNSASIILIENLRFFPGEKMKDEEFAQQLRNITDYYVDDAFASLHRDDASIAILPTLYPEDKRSIGLLVQHELQALSSLKNPKHPFVLIIGGGKVADKLPLLEGLFDSISTILLCPAFVFTFMKAAGQSVGKSLVYNEALNTIDIFLKKAAEHKVQIIYPQDYLIGDASANGTLSIVPADKIPQNGFGISIGPETINKFTPYILNAKTILFNCAMGFFDNPETLMGTEKLLRLIGLSTAYSVIAGGESVAAVNYFSLQKSMNYMTTGGGAVLTYLGNKKLPGLADLCHN